MPTSYSFTTRWTFEAPPAEVWAVVSDVLSYPKIWSDFKRVTLCSGDGHSVGSVVEAETRGRLPYTLRYRLTLLEADEPRHILSRSTGDLVGTGRWELTGSGGTTHVVYHWDVATTRRMLNLVAPLFKGLLAKNHDQVMGRGYQAFVTQLRTRAAR